MALFFRWFLQEKRRYFIGGAGGGAGVEQGAMGF